jgi:hypothetical protein
MNAIAAQKSRAQNRLEGIALTAIFQVLPTFAAAAMLFKLNGHEIAGRATLFVVLVLTFHALLAPWLQPKFPKFFKNGYEPLFFDASLPVAEKLARWRVQPAVSQQLMTTVLMLSSLAVVLVSVG